MPCSLYYVSEPSTRLPFLPKPLWSLQATLSQVCYVSPGLAWAAVGFILGCASGSGISAGSARGVDPVQGTDVQRSTFRFLSLRTYSYIL